MDYDREKTAQLLRDYDSLYVALTEIREMVGLVDTLGGALTALEQIKQKADRALTEVGR
jgi:hypothetical protein